jgi:CubicO group peptidase (beta-lactamase class C family)
MSSEKYYALMNSPDAAAQIMRDAKVRPLDFTPGSQFKYSNTGYIALAHIIANASHTPFEDYMIALLRRAGMNNSVPITSPLPDDVAKGYTYGDIGWQKMLGGFSLTDGTLQAVPRVTLTKFAGEGFLVSSLEDLLHWTTHLTREMITPNELGYAYGWIADSAFGRPRVQHNGILPGAVSQLVVFPEDSVVVIVFANVDRVRLRSVVRDLSAIALGKPFDMPVRGNVATASTAQFDALLGDYRMSAKDTLHVTYDGKMLAAEWPGRFTAGLIPLSPTEFYMPLADGRVTFTLENGKARAINMRWDAADHAGNRIP